MQELLIGNFNNILTTAIEILPKLVAAIIAFLIVIYFGRFVNGLIKQILKKSDILEIHRELYLKISKIFFLFIAITLFLNVVGLKSIATGLFAGGGIITVVLGFAFREIGENLIAGILLSFNRPFRKGDLIKSGNFEGSVKSIQIRNTHIRSSDGQDIFIPSAQIYKNTLINYTKDGFRRFTLNIGISYENDLDLACEIIENQLNQVKGVLKRPKSSVTVNQSLPKYIELSINFWVDVFSSDNNVGKIKNEILAKVKENLIHSEFTLSHEVSDNVNFKLVQDSPIINGLAH